MRLLDTTKLLQHYSVFHILISSLLCSYSVLAEIECLSPCPVPVSGEFAGYPACARPALGCIDSSLSFAHNCGAERCCVGKRENIKAAFGCVTSFCSESDAQMTWIEFIRECAQMGYQVDIADQPPGVYSYVSFTGEFSGYIQSTYRENTAEEDIRSPQNRGFVDTNVGTDGNLVPTTASDTIAAGPTSSTPTQTTSTVSLPQPAGGGLTTGDKIALAVGIPSGLAGVAAIVAAIVKVVQVKKRHRVRRGLVQSADTESR